MLFVLFGIGVVGPAGGHVLIHHLRIGRGLWQEIVRFRENTRRKRGEVSASPGWRDVTGRGGIPNRRAAAAADEFAQFAVAGFESGDFRDKGGGRRAAVGRLQEGLLARLQKGSQVFLELL
jgi:hypothetical protein